MSIQYSLKAGGRYALLLLAGISGSLLAQTPTTHAYRDRTAAILEAKTYPLLSLLDTNPAAHHAVQADKAITAIAIRRAAAIKESNSCQTSLCYTSAFKWSDSDITSAGDALTALYAANATFRTAVDRVIQSGVYEKFASDAVRKAWVADARGMNQTIAIYGEAAAPPYPKIDAIEYDPNSKDYLSLLRTASLLVQDEAAPNDLFFKPSLSFALSLLRINMREDAAHFEPMERGVNASAVTHARTIAWAKYPYSAILVPGIGNENEHDHISPMGHLHVAIAADRFRRGMAPFLIVSGGSVHPAHTFYVEAEEMKRELMERYGIPENAILMEPHARHTTTNLRNAVREMMQYHFPMDKSVLIVCNERQVIATPKFATRNMTELHYLPWKSIRKISTFETEFTPNPESLRVDSLSPLDP